MFLHYRNLVPRITRIFSLQVPLSISLIFRKPYTNYFYTCVHYMTTIKLPHSEVIDEDYIKTLFAATGGTVVNFRFFQWVRTDRCVRNLNSPTEHEPNDWVSYVNGYSHSQCVYCCATVIGTCKYLRLNFDFFIHSNDRRMALIQMGSTEEATAALIVCIL